MKFVEHTTEEVHSKHDGRKLLRCRAVLSLALGLALGGCAAGTSDACGVRPTTQVEPEKAAFPDPYSQWRRFRRTADRYNVALSAGDESLVRGAAWNVCGSALGLQPFTREVALEIRPRFTEALAVVVARANETAQGAWKLPSTVPERSLGEAISELSAAIPRFWLSPAARLRGSRQPGSPLHTHK
jgi:hypothetical protein